MKLTSRTRLSLQLKLATAAMILTLAAPTLHAQTPAATNLVVNADFSASTQKPGWPDAWQNEKDGLVTQLTENGKSFLRLVSQQPNQLVLVSQTVPIPAGVKGIDYSDSFRTSGVKFGASYSCDARIMFEFLNADNQPVKSSAGAAPCDSHAKDWTPMKRQFLVPEGAVSLKVMLCINKAASGTLDVADIRVASMSSADVDTITMAPVLMAKKKTDDEAEVQRMLTAPPKSIEIKVAGNKLVKVDGTPAWLQGVNVPSLEWSAKGENIPQSVKVATEEWKANVVRLSVYDGFWFGHGKPPQSAANDAEAYRAIVDNVVKMVAGQGAYVILDLHRFHAPDEGSAAFWKDAATRYKNNPTVLFDIFNEAGGISWDVWRNGGDVQDKVKPPAPPHGFKSPGMQGLVDTIRGVGARNVIIAGGLGSAYDLMGVLQGYALDDKGGDGIVYATHFYNWHKNWEKHFLPVAAKYPLLVGELGADVKKMPFVPAKDQEDPATWVPDALGLIQKYHLNWTAYSLHTKSTPVLISNWNYDPTPFWGVYVKDALSGKQFELKKMR